MFAQLLPTTPPLLSIFSVSDLFAPIKNISASPPRAISVALRACRAGEYMLANNFVCTVCAGGRYSTQAAPVPQQCALQVCDPPKLAPNAPEPVGRRLLNDLYQSHASKTRYDLHKLDVRANQGCFRPKLESHFHQKPKCLEI